MDELPGLIEGLEKDAEVSLSNAEKILGLREGTPDEVATESPKEPERKPVEETESNTEDEDGIGV